MEGFIKLLTPGVLWVVFALVGAFAVLITITLSYHWKEYATDSHRSVRFFRAYIVVLVVLMGTMATSILLYGS